MTALAEDVARIDKTLADTDEKVRGRLHVLENYNAAAKAAEAARAAVTAGWGKRRAERGQNIALALTFANIVAVVVLSVFR